MGGVKEGILYNLKSQWKDAVRKQYKEEPGKVRNANIRKNAEEIANNRGVKMACRVARVKITVEEIEKVLQEIRDEVIKETESESNIR